MKISVVTITFNAEQFLPKTMQSVASQTYSNIEYIIVDGKSTDRTVEQIKEFESELKNSNSPISLRWISEPDSGLYDAMNKGLHLATGDFVWFVNAGDKIFDNQTAQHIADAVQANPQCDVVYGQTLVIDHNDNPVGERHKIAPANLQKKHLLNGLVVCHQSILVRKTIAPDYNLKYRVSADYDWTCKVLEVSRQNVFINGYISRFMLAGVSNANRKASWIERFNSMRSHFGLLRTLWAHAIIIAKYPLSQKAR
ncbi:MAG: glycosyltransferase [Salinivirgaceae bacterium]|nr:glycosyltransferase [Salinivirgaceae bacterium]